MSNYILGYTREPIDNVYYDPRLAYSLHLALSTDGQTYESINHNSGVLFALATENEDGSLNPMSIRNPYIFARKEGGYGILAVRILADGEEDESSKGAVLYWTTEDFMSYQEKGLICLAEEYVEEAVCSYAEDTDCYEMQWKLQNGKCFSSDFKTLEELVIVNGQGAAETGSARRGGALPEGCKAPENILASEEDIFVPTVNTEGLVLVNMEGAILHNAMEIPGAVAERLRLKLVTPENIAVKVPESVEIGCTEELKDVKAVLLYSDGTSVTRRVDWETAGIDFTKAGEYVVRGKVHQDHFAFPMAFNRADPCMAYWKGKYYFISTNDADHEHTIYAREADSIPELVTAEDHLVLDAYTYEGIGGLLWAPEFHEINGKLYIFHAATPGEFFWEESHVMELREGGNPVCSQDWSAPRRVVKMDGSELCEPGKVITLDMTCFEWDGIWYAIWSQREFLPKDLGAWLYIAKLNPEKPWMLASEPVVLSKPDYGWGNNHTFVEEGPFALPVSDKLYITFSAAAVDTSYVVSYLVAEHGVDLLKPQNWRKNNYPILTSRSMEGEFGTGHNAYVTDEEGLIWNTYHARPGVDGVRSSGVRRVHLDVDGAPMLDVIEEKDCKEELKRVEMTVGIKGDQ